MTGLPSPDRNGGARGPMLYAQLMDKATREPLKALTEELDGYLTAAGRDIAEALVVHLRQAYAEGIRDGFQQGLAAHDR